MNAILLLFLLGILIAALPIPPYTYKTRRPYSTYPVSIIPSLPV
jgi:hypothetical protein